jgi:beta-carotene 3-hydroxylase
MLIDVAIVLAAMVGMEIVATLAHRHVMHGRLGWALHRDHHEPHDGALQRNDLYAVAAAALVMGLFVAGAWIWPLTQIAIGATIYGALYAIVHDGLVHQRWPFRHVPRAGYLRRLYQAHLLHHATQGRTGAVSFGFLYAPPIRKLKQELAAQERVAQAQEPGVGQDAASDGAIRDHTAERA